MPNQFPIIESANQTSDIESKMFSVMMLFISIECCFQKLGGISCPMQAESISYNNLVGGINGGCD